MEGYGKRWEWVMKDREEGDDRDIWEVWVVNKKRELLLHAATLRLQDDTSFVATITLENDPDIPKTVKNKNGSTTTYKTWDEGSVRSLFLDGVVYGMEYDQLSGNQYEKYAFVTADGKVLFERENYVIKGLRR